MGCLICFPIIVPPSEKQHGHSRLEGPGSTPTRFECEGSGAARALAATRVVIDGLLCKRRKTT